MGSVLQSYLYFCIILTTDSGIVSNVFWQYAPRSMRIRVFRLVDLTPVWAIDLIGNSAIRFRDRTGAPHGLDSHGQV